MRRIAVILVSASLVAGCSAPLTTREKGALAGGAIGAGTGAIIGNQVGHTGAGALIGAGVGAVSGVIIGDAIQGAEQRQAQAAPPPAAVAPPPPPVAVAPPPQQVVVVPPPQQVVVAAPPPVVVQGGPRMIWVPEWNAYVLEGQDVVYHQNSYYYFHNGYWWIGRSHRGPWTLVSSPPRAIARLPRGHLHGHIPVRHGCPPGQAKRGRC